MFMTASPTIAMLVVLMAVSLVLELPEAVAADHTDVVVMNNGDRMVGEIKRLDYGELRFKADYMADDARLDWGLVKQLLSTRRFRVEFADGALMSGSIYKSDSAAAGADFEVVDMFGLTTRGAFQVTSIEPIDGSWWSRLRGSADVGFTLQPEVGQTQWTGNATVEYPSEKFRLDTQVSTFFSQQEGAEDSIRDSFGLSYYQFLSRKWFLLGMTQLLKDNQLNLELRSTFSGGGGRFLTHSTRSGLAVFGGVAATNEKYFDTAENKDGTSIEALAGLEYYLVRFASSQIKTRVLTYTGLTDWGRVRVDWESSISWEIWNNFYWRLSVLENYDSRPPEGAAHNDFTMTTSFGLTF
jgi:hypothetical protein